MTKRVRYNRGDIEDTIRAAKRLNSSVNLYIFATYTGYRIDNHIPPFNQRYITVKPNGEIVRPSDGKAQV